MRKQKTSSTSALSPIRIIQPPKCSRTCSRIFPNLIKSYPSSNPLISQQHLAAVLHVNPENLLIGNGATELITLLNTTLIDRIAVPIPTFGEYIEKMKDQRDAELYPLNPRRPVRAPPEGLPRMGSQAQYEGSACYQSRQSHGPVHSAR